MFAIIDIETNGGNKEYGKITEIAIIVHDGEKIVKEYQTLVNPESNIPYHITMLTGIDNQMVAEAPRFYEIAKDIIEYTEDCVFVAHNVGFDYGFIKKEFANLGYEYKKTQLCTVKLSRKIMPGFPSYSLGKLCKQVGIELRNHHRAYADTLATTKLFELLLEKDTEDTILKSVNSQYVSKAYEPLVAHLPEATGVYYLYNNANDIIYIGKSNNIRKRVIDHLNNCKTKKAVRMREEISTTDFVVMGSELLALLKESDEIKKHKPIFNRAQKRSVFPYGLYSSMELDGYIRLRIAKNQAHALPIYSFQSEAEAREKLHKLVDKYQLCQKLCYLYKSQGACFHHSIKQCKGACINEEEPDEYNSRVEQLIKELHYDHQNFVLIDKGRTSGEHAYVWIENGSYRGFGYYHADENCDIEELRNRMEKYQDNKDIRHIIGNYIKQKKMQKLIQF